MMVRSPGKEFCEITMHLQVTHPKVGSEHPTEGRDASDPLWEDVAPSIAILVQAFCLFFKHC